MKFKAGDKVRVKKFESRPGNWNWEGKMDHLMGKIVKIKNAWGADCYDVYDEVHKRTWIFKEDQIEEPANETIVIYRKDNKIIALDKRTGNKTEARCCPEDTFDFKTGAKLAFERLMQCPNKSDKTKYYSGKIIFTKGDKCFKTGHIYEVVNGRIKYPGKKIFLPIIGERLKDIEDVKDYFAKPSNRKRKSGWTLSGLELIEVEDD